MADGTCGVNAFFNDGCKVLQVYLCSLQGTTAIGGEESSQRRIVPFQFAQARVSVFTREGLMDICELNLAGKLGVVQCRQPRQMRPHPLYCRQVLLPAKL